MDKKIPLSELIRIGSKITDRCSGTINSHDGQRTCALGAALTAKRGQLLVDRISTRKAVTELGIRGVKASHPEVGKVRLLDGIITDLNDCFRWSREKIADWLQSIGM